MVTLRLDSGLRLPRDERLRVLRLEKVFTIPFILVAEWRDILVSENKKTELRTRQTPRKAGFTTGAVFIGIHCNHYYNNEFLVVPTLTAFPLTGPPRKSPSVKF